MDFETLAVKTIDLARKTWILHEKHGFSNVSNKKHGFYNLGDQKHRF